MRVISDSYAIALIAIFAIGTAIIRFLPFIVFKKHTPDAVIYLGKVLPFSIMGMLVVYCLKDVSPTSNPHGIPELIACSLVLVLHKWKHSTLISILGGTISYMVLLQLMT